MTLDESSEDLLARICPDMMGSAVDHLLFRVERVGKVLGVRLEDGREVVVKMHPPGTSLARLRAVHSARAVLTDAGFPCPEAVLAPVRLPTGPADTVERLVTGGGAGRPRSSEHRRAMVEAFSWHMELLHDYPARSVLREAPAWANVGSRPGLWPPPHDPALRFHAIPETRWIDDLASTALGELRTYHGPFALAHCDWEAQNMVFDDGRVHAVWDWESLLTARRACLVGFAAGCYTAQHSPADAPSPPEVGLFLDEYAEVSGSPWTKRDRRAAAAATLWLISYNARFEHAAGVASGPWLTALTADYLNV
ncbi:phosphotransferase [Streptomyces sp. NPDC048309]|uniref:phosphotransferase n=1 Tax=Streptomyces sp. NPDC048309 TaxID=3154618 RepID=UPI0033F768B4